MENSLRLIQGIEVAGNVYNVLVDNFGKIQQTECIGRWTMNPGSIGDIWLERELQRRLDWIGDDVE